MAVNPISSIKAYWGSDYSVHKYVVLAMTYNRFQDISRNFSITNGIPREFDRVY
jgi:hypothetical protein